jgi:hypothetical protein
MTFHLPSIQTLFLITLFAMFYLWHLLRKTLRDHIDFYDFLMLSMVAVIPAAFAYFPHITDKITSMMGIAFPFIIMFGLLLAVVFIIVHRLTVRIHKLETQSRLLIQEVGLLQLGDLPDKKQRAIP